MGKVIGYAKLGRSMPLTLDKCGNLGGDVEMVAVVKELALRHPEDEFVLIGRNSGERPSDIGLPPNITNPWLHWKPELDERVRTAGLKGVVLEPAKQLQLAMIMNAVTGSMFDRLDAMVMWVGQHGTSNTPIPKVGAPDELTKPQDWCAWYSGFLLRGINRWRDKDPWRREEINLNADARNRHKMRDLKWPLRHPILAQYDFEHPLKHFRWGDTNPPVGAWATYAKQIERETWYSTVKNIYARLEVNGLRPGTPFGDLISFNDTWEGRGKFGLFINEARAIGVREDVARLPILKEWILPLQPTFIHGTWSKESGFHDTIKPAPWDQYYPRLHSVRSTFTTPSSGSGWATAKPWEAFAAGTPCFFHPAYDTQNHILGDAPEQLRHMLRVRSADELRRRVDWLNSEDGFADWHYIVAAQRAHFDAALADLRYMKIIEERIYG